MVPSIRIDEFATHIGDNGLSRFVWLRHTVRQGDRSAGKVPPQEAKPSSDAPYAVRVIDNPVNTYQEVMDVCSEALGISFEAAYGIASTIDTAGSCVVCVAPRSEAERVAAHIARIGIEVRLEPAEAPISPR